MSKFETVHISSRRYFLNRIFKYVYFVLSLILFFLVYGGRMNYDKGYLIRMNSPQWVIYLGVVLFFLFVILYLKSLIGNSYKLGRITVTDTVIKLHRKDITYKLSEVSSLEILLDTTKYKLSKNRDFTKGAGNNWFIFIDKEKKCKIEFLIETKEQEEQLLNVLKTWNNDVKYVLGEAKPIEWEL